MQHSVRAGSSKPSDRDADPRGKQSYENVSSAASPISGKMNAKGKARNNVAEAPPPPVRRRSNRLSSASESDIELVVSQQAYVEPAAVQRKQTKKFAEAPPPPVRRRSSRLSSASEIEPEVSQPAYLEPAAMQYKQARNAAPPRSSSRSSVTNSDTAVGIMAQPAYAEPVPAQQNYNSVGAHSGSREVSMYRNVNSDDVAEGDVNIYDFDNAVLADADPTYDFDNATLPNDGGIATEASTRMYQNDGAVLSSYENTSPMTSPRSHQVKGVHSMQLYMNDEADDSASDISL